MKNYISNFDFQINSIQLILEEEKEKERLQRIAYCAELMKKEKMKEEEEEERKLCVPAIAPTVPQTMDERLELIAF